MVGRRGDGRVSCCVVIEVAVRTVVVPAPAVGGLPEVAGSVRESRVFGLLGVQTGAGEVSRGHGPFVLLVRGGPDPHPDAVVGENLLVPPPRESTGAPYSAHTATVATPASTRRGTTTPMGTCR